MKLKTILLLLLAFSAFAQKPHQLLPQAGVDLFLPSYKSTARIYNFDDEAVKEAIMATAHFRESVDLELRHKIKSKVLTHYRFDIQIDGLPIYAASIHASLDTSGKLRIQNIPTIPKNINGNFPLADFAKNIQDQTGAENIIKNK